MSAATRISKQQLVELFSSISPRDKIILHSLYKCRYLTTNQITRLHFMNMKNQRTSIRATNRNLAKLKKCGLIECLTRRVGGGYQGSDPYIWFLKPAGAKLLLLECSGISIRNMFLDPSQYFLKHTLGIAETYVQLTEICSKHNIELANIEFEPECWRYYKGRNSKNMNYRPDLYVVTRNKRYEYHWFVEVDLATESYPTIINKCERCILYFKTGSEQKKNGVFPFVLWIVPNDNRKNGIRRQLIDHYTKVPELFVIITPQELESLITCGVDAYLQKTKRKAIPH